ncbi:MAG: STAS domain-containing protein [Candidatus Cybelea sp.]
MGSYASVVALDGEFDLADRQRLADAFDVAAQGAVVIVDLSQTTYIDSTVLWQLVKLRNRNGARPPVELILTQPTGSVLRLFDVSQIFDLFVVRPSAESALTELGWREKAKHITVAGRGRDAGG